jgi:hypothetical protein
MTSRNRASPDAGYFRPGMFWALLSFVFCAYGVSGYVAGNTEGKHMTREELTTWALANGWQIIGGVPSLTKPSSPKEAIVKMVFKATVVGIEVKKPAGKWEKISSAPYQAIQPDAETDRPVGLGFEKIPSFSMLMQENKDRQTFAKFGK